VSFLLRNLDAFYLEHRRCGELDGGVEDTHALGHDFLVDPVIGDRSDIRCFMRAPPSASS
jgi:hypothetical protein